MKEPSEDTLANRKAARELMSRAAVLGDPICGAAFELEAAAATVPGGSYAVGTAYEFRDEDDDDEMRPF